MPQRLHRLEQRRLANGIEAKEHRLVRPVLADMGDSSVEFRQFPGGLAPVGTAFLLAGMLSGSPLQAVQRLFQRLGAVDFLPRGQRNRSTDSEINPNRRLAFADGFGTLDLNGNRNKPPFKFSRLVN